MARKNQQHRREKRRQEAEKRQADYKGLTVEEKLTHAGPKERNKLEENRGQI